MAALEPDYFEPNMPQTLQMITVKIVKSVMDGKVHFADLLKVPDHFSFFSLPPIESDRMLRHNHCLAAKYSFFY